ncbi:MAG: hypothetical protein ABI573_01415 [Chloroflexota bacterium]
MTVASPYADEVRRVRALGVETGDIARATGAAMATVTSWIRSERRPSAGYRDRLMDLVAIVDRLATTMDEAYVPLWLNKPISALGDERPLIAIRKGRYREVSKLVAELENSSFA